MMQTDFRFLGLKKTHNYRLQLDTNGHNQNEL